MDLKSISQRRITSNTDKDGFTTSTLRLRSAKLTDGGIYSCIAINDVGETQHSARINIYGNKANMKTHFL